MLAIRVRQRPEHKEGFLPWSWWPQVRLVRDGKVITPWTSFGDDQEEVLRQLSEDAGVDAGPVVATWLEVRASAPRGSWWTGFGGGGCERQARQKTFPVQEPEPEITVRVKASETADVPAGDHSVADVRSMMHRARYHAPVGGGYDKVHYALVRGKETLFEGRCDVQHIDRPGDGDACPVEHARRAARWALSERGRAFFEHHPHPWAPEDAQSLLDALEGL